MSGLGQQQVLGDCSDHSWKLFNTRLARVRGTCSGRSKDLKTAGRMLVVPWTQITRGSRAEGGVVLIAPPPFSPRRASRSHSENLRAALSG